MASKAMAMAPRSMASLIDAVTCANGRPPAVAEPERIGATLYANVNGETLSFNSNFATSKLAGVSPRAVQR